MRTRTSKYVMAAQLATALALLVSPAIAAMEPDESEALNRSFYVPLRLRLCEHLDRAVLYRGETPLRELPGQQTVQFTFYPALKRLEPELEKLRVVGRTSDGEAFRVGLVVTPASVYVGSRRIELDLDEQIKRLRGRLDARYETVVIDLRCQPTCRRSASSRAVTSSDSSSRHRPPPR